MAQDPPRVNHSFSLSQLSYDKPPNIKPYIRISMFFNKKPGISYEFFQNHWHHVHADLVTSMRAYKECNLLRYNQFHQTPEHKELAKKIGLPSMEWDACTEFWFERIEDFDKFTKSEEYAKATQDGIKVMVGYDNLIYGEAVPGYGKDGVVKGDIEKLHGT
ncbi:hypothetical protein NA57DRAFT_60023 [Rhizodiscina lignyota]|uniref:EthD domain-containing protein n=1 Tax=Rhizodiscina lignyota TaxID=1504668 RepID=A0A9P4I9D3_9PEZI|nr:hypothetical protein NA57DRAFT_60023 [Rhizodiscina lignyota]